MYNFKNSRKTKDANLDTAIAFTVCLPAGKVNGAKYCIVYRSDPTLGKGSGFFPLIV